MKPLKFDIENRLRNYFPILFEVLDDNKIDWAKVEKTFRMKFEEYKRKQSKLNSTFRIEASFYNIITSAIKKEPDAIRLLDYIQKLFEELADRLDKEEKKQIVKNIFDLLTNIDMKYLNFLGELSVLNLLKQTQPFKLLKTEEPLIKERKNGSKIDFKFLNTENNKQQLVEIVNIHLTDKNTLTIDNINNLLTQKITDKLNRTGIKEKPDFQLVPVLWGQWTKLKSIESFYKISQPRFPNTTTPVCFMSFTDQNGIMVHKFGTIDTIFLNVAM